MLDKVMVEVFLPFIGGLVSGQLGFAAVVVGHARRVPLLDDLEPFVDVAA